MNCFEQLSIDTCFWCIKETSLRIFFLAHQMGVSDVFTHMRKFYPTYVVPTLGKDKNWAAAGQKTNDVVIVMIK